MTGDVAGVTFDNVKYGQARATGNADLPLNVIDGAQQPQFRHGAQAGRCVHRRSAGLCAAAEGRASRQRPSPGARYTWLFGDGTAGHGRQVQPSLSRRRRHRARRRATARAASAFCFTWRTKPASRTGPRRAWWSSPSGTTRCNPAGPTAPGLDWKIYPGTWTELPDLTQAAGGLHRASRPICSADAQGFTRYAAAWDGFIDIPADGGYTFHLIDRDGARLVIDGVEVAKTGPPFAQVCGSPGNAMRYDRGSLGLRAGKHTFHVEGLHTDEPGRAAAAVGRARRCRSTDVPPAALQPSAAEDVRDVG